MATEALTDLSISQLAGRIKSRKLSPVELAEATLRRIEELEPKLNAFITVTGDRALADADKAEREIAAGNYRGPLHGIPWAVKDLAATKGIPTSSGAYFERDRIPDEDATVVSKLDQAGAVIVGKTNTVQFAYGSIEHDEKFGEAHNPWKLDRVPTGSSTGSAASLAARVVPWLLERTRAVRSGCPRQCVASAASSRLSAWSAALGSRESPGVWTTPVQ